MSLRRRFSRLLVVGACAAALIGGALIPADSAGPGGAGGPGPSASLVQAREGTAWSDAIARHYAYLDPQALAGVGVELTWLGTLLLVGGYQGTFEPCGCTAGRLGGQAWEAPIVRALRDGLGPPVWTASVGRDVLEAGAQLAGELGQAHRALGAAHLGRYFDRLGIELWAQTLEDSAFWSAAIARAGDAHSVRVLAPGDACALHLEAAASGGWPRTAGAAPHVALVAADLSHASSRKLLHEAARGAVAVVGIVHDKGTDRSQALRSRDVVGGTQAMEGAGWILVDVDNALDPRAAEPTSPVHVLRWGLGQGTTLGALRFAALRAAGGGPRRSPGSSPKVLDLRELRSTLAMSGTSVRAEWVTAMLAGGAALGFDWWQIPIGHQGAQDAAVTESLAALQAERSELLRTYPGIGSEAGSDASCGACHAQQWREWSGDPHSHAFHTLHAAGRHQDPNCLRCHSTAFRLGWQEGRDNGVTCASCHGVVRPGHENLADAKVPRVERARCVECHTPVASPAFDAAERWPRVCCVEAGRR